MNNDKTQTPLISDNSIPDEICNIKLSIDEPKTNVIDKVWSAIIVNSLD